MHSYKFWAAAGAASAGLIVMAIMGRNQTDGVHVENVVEAAILACVFLASWMLLDGQRQEAKQQKRILRRLDDLDRARDDDELLVAKTIRATLKATGHELERADAKVYKIHP